MPKYKIEPTGNAEVIFQIDTSDEFTITAIKETVHFFKSNETTINWVDEKFVRYFIRMATGIIVGYNGLYSLEGIRRTLATEEGFWFSEPKFKCTILSEDSPYWDIDDTDIEVFN